MSTRAAHPSPDGGGPARTTGAPPALPRPLAVVAMEAADRAAFVRSLAQVDGTLPDDIAVLTAAALADVPTPADAEALAGATVDLRRRDLDAAVAAEEGAAAAARVARAAAEDAERARAATLEEVTAARETRDRLAGQLEVLRARAALLRGEAGASLARAERLDRLAVDAARGRDDLRHRAAVALLTGYVEVEADRRAPATADDDPAVAGARAALRRAEAALESVTASFGPGGLDDEVRRRVEALHDEVVRHRGRRRAEAQLAEAVAAETALLEAHGFASYLDFQIGSATLDVGALAAAPVAAARDEVDRTRRTVAAAEADVRHRVERLDARAVALDGLADLLAAATTAEELAAVVGRLPAVTGDPAAWSEYARRGAAAVRAADPRTAELARTEAEVLAVAAAADEAARRTAPDADLAASTDARLAELWAAVTDAESALHAATGARTAAAVALADAESVLQRRRDGDLDEVADLLAVVSARTGDDPTVSVLLDDALSGLPPTTAAAVLDGLARSRPDGDVLCLTTDPLVLEWAAGHGVLGRLEPWWDAAEDGADDRDAGSVSASS